MAATEDEFYARRQKVVQTLQVIDKLDADKALSILRCIATNDLELDSRGLAMVVRTIRETYYETGRDSDDGCDASQSFSDRKKAGQHWIRMWNANAEKQAQQARDAQTAIVTTADDNGSLDDFGNTKYESDKYNQPDSDFGLSVPNQDDKILKNDQPTTIVNRGGHITINNTYHINGQGARHREPKPDWILCGLCNDWYLEEENVLRDDGRPPCGYHTGSVVDYGHNEARAYRRFGVRRTGEAWNCCRRAPNSAGCHPAYHEPSES